MAKKYLDYTGLDHFWTKCKSYFLGGASPEDVADTTNCPKMDGTKTYGTSHILAREDHVHPTDTSRAPLASPAFTGNPTAPTQSTSDDSTKLATTAFVHDLVDNISPGSTYGVVVPGTAADTDGTDGLVPAFGYSENWPGWMDLLNGAATYTRPQFSFSQVDAVDTGDNQHTSYISWDLHAHIDDARPNHAATIPGGFGSGMLFATGPLYFGTTSPDDNNNQNIVVGVNTFTGCSQNNNGYNGIVPRPLAGYQNTVLFGSGDWKNLLFDLTDYSSVIPDAKLLHLMSSIPDSNTANTFANVIFSPASSSSSGLMSSTDKAKLDALSDGGCWYGTSSTTASTAAKVVTCAGFTLKTGSIIAVLFSTANTAATPTLNVNSTGAKSIHVGNATPNATTNVLKWSANTLIFFMYDGTQYKYLSSVAAASVTQPRGANTWYGTCSTAEGTAAKTASIDNFVLTKGAIVSLQMTTKNTATAAITLNVNSTGAKTIYYKNSATSSTNWFWWNVGNIVSFIYDGTYWRVLNDKEVSASLGIRRSPGTNGYAEIITADLLSYTALTNAAAAATEVVNRVYPVALDSAGHLAVNVPWADTTYSDFVGSRYGGMAGTHGLVPAPPAKNGDQIGNKYFLLDDGYWHGGWMDLYFDSNEDEYVLRVRYMEADGETQTTLWSCVIPAVTTTNRGMMRASDKVKLDSIIMTNGVIDSSVLPSYVDDVIEAYPRSGQTELGSTWLSATSGGSALTPETGKIYILMGNTTNYSTNDCFRWSGSTFVKLYDGGVSSITNAEIDTIVANPASS